MRRTLAIIAALLLTGTSALAQQSKSIASTTCSDTDKSGCFVVNTQGAGSLGIDVRGTFVGTLEFEQSVSGSTYVTMASFPNASGVSATSTTTTGYWVANPLGALYVRFRFSAFTSGAAVVSVARSTARSETVPTATFASSVFIGTASTSASYGAQPNGPLHFVGTTSTIYCDHISADAVPCALIGRKARGTVNVPTQATANDNLVQIIGQGWETTTPGWTSGAIGDDWHSSY
jgi:hypothetical protein